MPYKRIPPADVGNMRKRRYLGHFTICEKTREIWRIGRELEEKGIAEGIDLQLKAREAMAMGKRMQDKLKHYGMLIQFQDEDQDLVKGETEDGL
jgi:hypothetical protein